MKGGRVYITPKTDIIVVILLVICFGGKKVGKKSVVVVFFVFFGDWWPVPSFRNSPFHRYLSNGPYPVPHFALQPQFWSVLRIV